jgi:hypothetical protein
MKYLKQYRTILSAGFLAFFFCSCQSASMSSMASLPAMMHEAPSADIAMAQLIREKKIVFLSEDHAIVNPVLFLAKNIRSFHDAGMRFLFLEGGFPALPSSKGYGFPLFFPWSQVGWKYESVALAQALADLNGSLPETERIRILFAEEGDVEPKVYDPLKVPESLNGRDRYAYERILGIMEKSRPEEKALIFYGGGHGSKRIWEDQNQGGGIPVFDWKPMAAYLKDHYQEQFCTVDFQFNSVYRESAPTSLGESPATGSKMIRTESLKGNGLYDRWGRYDAVILDEEPIYGTGYQYVPTDANLRYMFRDLRDNEASIERIVKQNGNFRFQSLGRYLMEIYYLKLYFGENFEYRFWNSRTSLASALDELGRYAFAEGLAPSSRISGTRPSAGILYKYQRLMRESGIERYIASGQGNPSLVGSIIDSMQEATLLYPDDLWALYWLAFAHTKHGDSMIALSEWEELFSKPLSSCMEALPDAYAMAIDCARDLGLGEKVRELEAKAATLSNEHRIDVGDFPDLR